MTIGVLTAVWKRPRITDYCLRHTMSHQTENVRLRGIATVSEPNLSLPTGWETLEVPNFPLGAKWNAGLRAFKGSDIDGLLIMGSDDIVTPSVIQHYAETNPAFATLAELFVLDSKTLAAIRIYRGRIGAGRYIRRDVLEACDWHLWDDEINKSLDRSVEKSVGYRPDVVKPHGHRYVLDIKSQANIWSFRHLAGVTRSERITAKDLEPMFGISLDEIAKLGP